MDAENVRLENEIRGMKAEIHDLKIALGEARGRNYPTPKQGWQCFHCGEWFTTHESAKSHFGESPEQIAALRAENEQIKTVEFPRRAEAITKASRAKIADLDAEIAALKAENEQLKQAILQHRLRQG